MSLWKEVKMRELRVVLLCYFVDIVRSYVDLLFRVWFFRRLEVVYIYEI